MKKQRADKTISLNEQQRIQEKKEAEARIEARKKERDARPISADKVFLVKTETVDKNQPLIAVTPPKPKKSDDVAKSEPVGKNPPAAVQVPSSKAKEKEKADAKPFTVNLTGEPDEDDTTDAGKAIIDVYLRETLSILGDYARQQAKKGSGEIVAVPR